MIDVKNELLKQAVDFVKTQKGCSIDTIMSFFKTTRNHAEEIVNDLECMGEIDSYRGRSWRVYMCRRAEPVETPNQTLWATFFSEWQKFDMNQRADGTEQLTDIFTFAVNNFKGPEGK